LTVPTAAVGGAVAVAVVGVVVVVGSIFLGKRAIDGEEECGVDAGVGVARERFLLIAVVGTLDVFVQTFSCSRYLIFKRKSMSGMKKKDKKGKW